jgi:hypothetical protein
MNETDFVSERENAKMVDHVEHLKTPITPEDLRKHVPGWNEVLEKARILRQKHLKDVLDPVFLFTFKYDRRSTLKEKFSRLVGWYAPRDKASWVRSSEAYIVGYNALMRVLNGHG